MDFGNPIIFFIVLAVSGCTTTCHSNINQEGDFIRIHDRLLQIIVNESDLIKEFNESKSPELIWSPMSTDFGWEESQKWLSLCNYNIATDLPSSADFLDLLIIYKRPVAYGVIFTNGCNGLTEVYEPIVILSLDVDNESLSFLPTDCIEILD